MRGLHVKGVNQYAADVMNGDKPLGRYLRRSLGLDPSTPYAQFKRLVLGQYLKEVYQDPLRLMHLGP